ncbi:unnamed protein product [Urochloa humidicola]
MERLVSPRERLVSPPPPPPGVSPPTSPTPGATPAPATTLLTAPKNIPTPAPATTSSPLPTHPNDRSSPQAGRSKEQRWSDKSPASIFSGGSTAEAAAARRSYRDVVGNSVSSAAPSSPLLPAVASPPPCIVLRSAVHIPPPVRCDADGWEHVVSRSKRRKLAELSRRPRRPVPADLRGRCFNCFSGAHRAAQCKSQTRCFRCRALGHRSFVCPGRAPTAITAVRRPALPKRVSVW